MLGLYLHLPFCRVHCTYCPFAISTDLGMQDPYVDALLREIDARVDDDDIDTIYFGGGTPSRTSVENLTRIVERLPKARTEFSIESNPEDITEESLVAWRALGIDRISIGVQSFHDSELVPLGRIHGREGAREAVALAVKSGVRTNLDLILGLPNQTAESFRETLDLAIDLGAGHLSLYMLDLEEKTPLQVQVARGRTSLPDDELVAQLYVEAIEHLDRAGLHQYEISNFARAGEECIHNLRYWTRGEYHGLGLGAHSFIGTRRFANTRDMHHYIERSPDAFSFSEDLGSDEVRRETIFLGLRQTSGIDYENVRELCGQEGIEWIERGLRDGWLQQRDGRVAFTPAGFLQSTDYISQLF
ncbi:MAG TPA: radical SAM family heme chaperone HemW [Thermoanaerobaculia bacterium]|nr:radical SAM family heme chaperone HemW [Thermoanaerobaculia bacterium]